MVSETFLVQKARKLYLTWSRLIETICFFIFLLQDLFVFTSVLRKIKERFFIYFANFIDSKIKIISEYRKLFDHLLLINIGTIHAMNRVDSFFLHYVIVLQSFKLTNSLKDFMLAVHLVWISSFSISFKDFQTFQNGAWINWV